ncbi:MFS transporter [Comamonas sp. 26]|uniref:MFS transporter n=1 Tax=Comamonas sp. 26 TaxID=2035201 RepID=UPI000C18543F|nr:MFS transporter [Comamonas sp. 26]PIF98526.1 putative MFS family arabinose efflux permease [Comamonas sp. 26]
MTRPASTTPQNQAPETLRSDARTIGLIGLAHGSSHFFHLLLPPLFPWLIKDFGYSYSELSVLVSLFFIVSGTGQALAGFAVDRFGARPILFAALGSFTVAGLIASTAQGYAMLLAASFFAGLGNAPFHPVDFTILNKRVSQQRIGHAFSVHGLSGNIGWALAPVFMAGITTATGSWRTACFCGAMWALVVLVIMVLNRDALNDRADAIKAADKPAVAVAAPQEHPMAFMKLPSVWLCFSFFFWSTCALSAIQTFASPAMQSMYGLPLSVTALIVTGYMLCGAAGMVVGGFLVGRVKRLETVISICMLGSGLLLFIVGTGWLPAMVAVVVASLAGLGTGLAGPSRDMLIKRAAPPGATGRVYGTVYSGLDLGFCLAAPVFGYMLDHQMNNAVFYGSAIALVLSVVSAVIVGDGVSKKSKAALAPAA